MDSNTDNLAFFKFIIDSLPMAVVALDSDLKITEFNPWAEKITGHTAAEAIGHYCGEILQGGMCGGACPLKSVLSRSHCFVRIRTTVLHKNGQTIPVRFSTAGLFDKGGNLIGAVETFQDISHVLALERERANLTSMFAHDMRSSLSGIHGLGLRLMRKTADMALEDRMTHLELITREAAKLESLVDDFLEFSRLETGRLGLHFSAVSLDRELEELFDVYQVRAAQHGVKLELQVTEILPVVEADANRLRRVFTNLLDNALKFSEENGAVTITAKESGENVLVEITDEGIGIPGEDLPYVFDLFHRGSEVGTREGFGLGLATVKAIVEGHGGRVFVASQPGRGSTFTVLLPKHAQAERHLGEEEEA